MTFLDEMREKHAGLWERVVRHPFVVELGEGTLPEDVFRRYFVQDYVFVKDLVSMVAMGIARAPDLASAGRLDRFLAGILSPENDLFQRALAALGVPEADRARPAASPTTRAFGDFLVRIGLEGPFEDALTALYVTEGSYLDWASRLVEAGKRPQNPLYREWIHIHGPEALGDFVGWLRSFLDSADLARHTARLEDVFVTALRYEYLFWEAARKGEAWPEG